VASPTGDLTLDQLVRVFFAAVAIYYVPIQAPSSEIHHEILKFSLRKGRSIISERMFETPTIEIQSHYVVMIIP
jgi:hypothetical protein